MKNSTHPRALWWLSLIYALYAVTYGVLFANLLIYSDQSARIGFSENHAFLFFASFGTLTFILPLIGGFLCDRCGFVQVAKLGLLLGALGLFSLGLADKHFFVLGVALCLTGNALTMPAIWSMVGMIYGRHNSARESGSTLFYLTFNFGFLIAFSLSSLIAVELSYSVMFMLFSLGSLAALIVLLCVSKTIPHLPSVSEKLNSLIPSTLGIFVVTTALLYFLVLNNILMWLFTLSIFIYLIVLNYQHKDLDTKKSIKAFGFLCVFGIIGITIYNSEFGLLPEFAQHAVNLQLYSHKLPAQIITSLDPLFCIILGLILSRLWTALANSNKNPKLATKLSLGIIIPALGYLLLAFALYFNVGAKLPLFWLLPIFLLFVIGELLVMPIGISMASQLAPAGKEGLFMGCWNVMQGFSSLLTGYLAFFTVVNIQQTQIEVNTQYFHVFFYSGLAILLAGVISFIVRSGINRLL